VILEQFDFINKATFISPAFFYLNEHIELAWWPKGMIWVAVISDLKDYKILFMFLCRWQVAGGKGG